MDTSSDDDDDEDKDDDDDDDYDENDFDCQMLKFNSTMKIGNSEDFSNLLDVFGLQSSRSGLSAVEPSLIEEVEEEEDMVDYAEIYPEDDESICSINDDWLQQSEKRLVHYD